jgi:hypothetical protein
MAEILRVLTPEQIAKLGRDYIVSKNSQITNFNDGSAIQSILEAIGLIESTTGASYLEALKKAIPVALYDGLKFNRKGATNANGFVRIYRIPKFTLEYTGTEPFCNLSINSNSLVTNTGNVLDDLNIDLNVFNTIQSLVAEINNNPKYNATVIPGNELNQSNNLFPFINLDIKPLFNFQNNPGVGILTNSDLEITIPTTTSFIIDSQIYQTVEPGFIPDGLDTSNPISINSNTTGSINNKSSFALDTFNGKGAITSSIIGGVVYAINDVSISGGTEEESDDDRALRFQITVNGLNGGTNFNIQAKILEIPQIRSVAILERTPLPGTNTIVADRGDGTLTLEDINAMKLKIEGDPNDIANNPGVGVAGMNYNYAPPVVVPLPVTITVIRKGILSDSQEILNAVRNAISNYINTRRLGVEVVANEIEALALFAHPSVYDVNLVTPNTNVIPNTNEVLRVGIFSAPLVLNLVTI